MRAIFIRTCHCEPLFGSASAACAVIPNLAEYVDVTWGLLRRTNDAPHRPLLAMTVGRVESSLPENDFGYADQD